MKIFIIICLTLGLAGTIFGYWGQYTETGHRKFDEMDGIIPFFAFYLGIFLLALASAGGAYLYFKSN